MERRNGTCKACVTGGSGYIASRLIKKLLNKGYTVHATLRDLRNESKVTFLKSFPKSEGQLVLFEADIYRPTTFDPAIQGCQFVFHVATPMSHQPSSEYKDITEATLAALKSIVMSCVRAGTVMRLIYTSSIFSASPLKDDGNGFKDTMDETCWTPLSDSLSFLFPEFHRFKEYIYSKTLTEQHLLSYEKNENGGLEVVILALGLVGGDTLQSFPSGGLLACISLISKDERKYNSLKFVQRFLGKIPLVHIDDVCEAHVFCMENASMSGRFLCASSYISLEEIADHFVHHYPEFDVIQEYTDGLKKDIKWASTKLCDKGFVYKYDAKMILDDSIKCARRLGDL